MSEEEHTTEPHWFSRQHCYRIRAYARRPYLIEDGLAPPGKWERSFDLSSRRFSKQVLIELRSESFVPKGVMDGGKNTDTRMLGVQVKGIMLRRDDAK